MTGPYIDASGRIEGATLFHLMANKCPTPTSTQAAALQALPQDGSKPSRYGKSTADVEKVEVQRARVIKMES